MHLLDPHPHHIALISAHTSPLDRLGGKKAGGLNVYVRETATELARLGYEVDVFTRDDGSRSPIVSLAPRARVVHLEAGPRARIDKDEVWEHLPAFLHTLRSFRERQGLRYDLVHSHYWLSGWVGHYLQRLWDVPHVTMFHTLGEAKNRARADEHESAHRIQTERRVIATADSVVAATEHERALLVGAYEADPARVAVLPCGVNLGRFQPLDRADCRRRLGLGAGPLVLFVGRLEPLKGLDLLIDTMAELKTAGATLLVVGGDDDASSYVQALHRRAEAAGVAERLRFAGSVGQDVLARYYNAADVCVVPSFYESFGLVALEAMACGTPVVASRVGGLPATVHDDENGYLIPWREPAAFAAKIDALLGDTALRDRLSRGALATAADYQWAGVATSLDVLYSRLWRERTAAACHALPVAVAAGRHAQAACGD